MVFKITEIYPEYKTQDKMQNPTLQNKHVQQDGFVFSKNTTVIDSELQNDINKSIEFFKSAKKLQDDVDRFDLKSKENIDASRKALYALSPLPPLRRISSLPDSIENDNLPRAAGLLGLAAANFSGDMREIGKASTELFGKKSISKVITNPNNIYQHPLSFFRGTFLEFLPDKFNWLNKIDKTLYDVIYETKFSNTRFGNVLKKFLNVNIKDFRPINKDEFNFLNIFKKTKVINPEATYITAYKSSLTGRVLLRIPVIGLAAMSLLEMPAIIKSAKTGETKNEKAKSFIKQICKSAGYVALVTAGIAVAGAAFVTAGTAASLIGMAIGSTIGIIASKTLNKQIDKIIA